MNTEKTANSLISFDVTVKTDRLVLRKLSLNDLDDMFEYTSDELCTQPLPWQAHKDKEQTRIFLENTIAGYGTDNSFTYGIELKEEAKLIGVVRLFDISFHNKRAEISYIMNRKYQGKGYANEAINAIIDFAFTKKEFIRIQARCSFDNLASVKVLERIGMSKEGVLKSFWNIKGVQKDVIIYGLLSQNSIKE